jgi:hypothetical protein
LPKPLTVAIPFKPSAPLPLLANTLPTVVATVLGTCVGKHQISSLIKDFAFAISQFDGFIFSHICKTI